MQINISCNIMMFIVFIQRQHILNELINQVTLTSIELSHSQIKLLFFLTVYMERVIIGLEIKKAVLIDSLFSSYY